MSNNPSMQAAFPLVLFGSIVLFVVMGLVSMLTRGNLYDQIGQGGLTMGEDQLGGGLTPGPGGPGGVESGAVPIGTGGEWASGMSHSSAGERAEREREIRQMLQARSDRLVRQGHAPLDIDAELARLEPAGGAPPIETPPTPPTHGSHDAALAEEVRQLVVARNERRGRKGLEPIDVEAEVQRTLDELDPR